MTFLFFALFLAAATGKNATRAHQQNQNAKNLFCFCFRENLENVMREVELRQPIKARLLCIVARRNGC
jgi:hypothetical protein